MAEKEKKSSNYHEVWVGLLLFHYAISISIIIITIITIFHCYA